MAQPTAAIGSAEVAGLRWWTALAIVLQATVIAVLDNTSGAAEHAPVVIDEVVDHDVDELADVVPVEPLRAADAARAPTGSLTGRPDLPSDPGPPPAATWNAPDEMEPS